LSVCVSVCVCVRERERERVREGHYVPIGLNHPIDGDTNHKYKLLHFWTTKYFFAITRRQ
jgi:hypothetical protein